MAWQDTGHFERRNC